MNAPTKAEAERLVKLIEECGEVIQAASKCLRHGYESLNPDDEGADTNRVALLRECADVMTELLRLGIAGDFGGVLVTAEQPSNGDMRHQVRRRRRR